MHTNFHSVHDDGIPDIREICVEKEQKETEEIKNKET